MHASVIIWILSAVLCGGKAHHHHDHKALADQDTTQDSSTNSVSLVKTANKEFAFRLYSKLASHSDSQDKNLFFSPASVSVALAALSVGARGDTHKQLFTGLGFNSSLLTQAAVDQSLRALLAKNVSQDASQGTAVFMAHKTNPLPEFLDALKHMYLTDGFTLVFTKSIESADTINKYVSDKTNGKIDKMVDRLDEATIMYLLSYIYFKGMWAKPFNSQLTREKMFDVNENTKVPVQMMYKEGPYDIYVDEVLKTSVLHLPFNSSYSMLLLLPDDMATLEKKICADHVRKWLNNVQSRIYGIFVPKFSINTTYSLNDILKEIGMSDMFSDNADFSGIGGEKRAVSEVVHKAALDVDEEGVTPAVVTDIEIIQTSTLDVPILKFDRPFMILIIERNTHDMLFIGKIINPTI